MISSKNIENIYNLSSHFSIFHFTFFFSLIFMTSLNLFPKTSSKTSTSSSSSSKNMYPASFNTMLSSDSSAGRSYAESTSSYLSSADTLYGPSNSQKYTCQVPPSIAAISLTSAYRPLHRTKPPAQSSLLFPFVAQDKSSR